MWKALQAVHDDVEKRPSRYWVPILCLYHGFRLNEVCSLLLKDVYEDDDGVFVIDVNAVGKNKSVKNKSSIRVVPVHPFVPDTLGFREFIESQKKARTSGLLFEDLSYNVGHGYHVKVSRWFAEWKETWLSADSFYKNAHGLRYTFIQTAQNVAGMSDRCCQEITGHTVPGVSAVHKTYSLCLKPKVVLEELMRVHYGWE